MQGTDTNASAGAKPDKAPGVPNVTRAKPASSILVVEDDRDVAAVLRLHLEDAFYRVTAAYDGNRGLDLALHERFDLIILDLALPGLDGLDICKRLARESGRPPMLILSARSTELDRVLGLELGADDYLTKPFSVHELVARVRALFRRSSGALRSPREADATRIVHAGPLVVDCWERRARLNDVTIELTTREFDLLLWFARHPGRVFSRAELLDAVWGEGYEGFEHTVNSHLNRLRSKLEPDPSRPTLLLTVRGAGYKLAVPA
jgi:DNA-binding response OmpR family regulator